MRANTISLEYNNRKSNSRDLYIHSSNYRNVQMDEMRMDTNAIYQDFKHPWEPYNSGMQEYRSRTPKPQKSFMPVHMLISGRLGTGKTASATWLAIYLMKLHRSHGWYDEHGIWQQDQRVISNYDIFPLLDEEIGSLQLTDSDEPIALPRGVIGISPKRIKDEETKVMYEQPGVGEWRKACSPDIVNEIAKYRPYWSYRNHIVIDEIADHVSNLRAGAQESRSMGAWLRQIRKMGMEGIFATQMIRQIPSGTVGAQIPIFVRIDAVRDDTGKPIEAVAMFYDYAGLYFKSSEFKYKGGMSFMEQKPDWIRIFPNLDKILPLYETEQLATPAWESDATKRRIQAEYDRAKQIGKRRRA